MMDAKYEVLDTSGTYLFGGISTFPELCREPAAEIVHSGTKHSYTLFRHYSLEFAVSDEMHEVFEHYDGRRVRMNFFSEKAEGTAEGYVDWVYGCPIVKLQTVSYVFTHKPSKKDEILAQLDELKRKIEEAE